MAAGTRGGTNPSTRAANPPSGVAHAYVSQAEIADVLGVVPRQVRNLEKAGLPREAAGYPVARCVRWYAERKFGEGAARALAKAAPTSALEAEMREAIARAELLEIKVQKERGDLVLMAVYEAEQRRVLFALRREINNLVGELAPHLLHITDLAEARRVVRTMGRDRLLRALQEAVQGVDADDEEEDA